MVQRTDKILAGACAILALLTANAAVTDDFESTEAGTVPTSWTGNGTVSELTYDYTKSVGHTITNENQTYTKVLAVEGQAVRSYDSTTEETKGESVVVDMMIKMAATDAEPDTLEDSTDVQIAVATGVATDGKVPLLYYSNGAWASTGKTYTEDSWVRLTMVMDYANSKCRMTVDGDVVVKEAAFVGTAKAEKTVSSITVEGLTAVDDIVVTANETSADQIAPFPADATSDTAKVGTGDDAVPVKLNWLYKNGLDGDTVAMSTTCEDGSGMTYAQKYEAGLDIADKKKFEVTSMSVTEAKSAVFTVPGKADSYEVEIDADGDSSTATPSTSTTDGVTTATVDLSGYTDKKVIKFKLKAKAVKAE